MGRSDLRLRRGGRAGTIYLLIGTLIAFTLASTVAAAIAEQLLAGEATIGHAVAIVVALSVPGGCGLSGAGAVSLLQAGHYPIGWSHGWMTHEAKMDHPRVVAFFLFLAFRSAATGAGTSGLFNKP